MLLLFVVSCVQSMRKFELRMVVHYFTAGQHILA